MQYVMYIYKWNRCSLNSSDSVYMGECGSGKCFCVADKRTVKILEYYRYIWAIIIKIQMWH